MGNGSSRPLSRKDQLVVQEHDGEVLIYDLRNNKAFCLNSTAALVWEACDGNREVSDISEHIAKKLNETNSDEFVWLALDRLKKEDLIENKEVVESKFNGMNRREVIKKVGLGSMIALPLVASLIAPQAIHAASIACSCPNGQAGNATSCTNSPQCAPGVTCSGVSCNGGGNNCGNLNGHCV